MELLGEYKGVVIDNKDSSKLGRVRVRVKGVFDSVPDEYIPWAFYKSASPAKLGGSWIIPEVGAKVSVRFMEGDINFPVYSGGVVEVAADKPKNATDKRHILYESRDKGITITVNDDIGDIEIRTKDYNTTLGEMISLFLAHGHQSSMGPTALPMKLSDFSPILAANFNLGSLQ